MDMLNLKDLEILRIEENDFDYLITAQAKQRPEFCISCYNGIDSVQRYVVTSVEVLVGHNMLEMEDITAYENPTKSKEIG